MSPPAILHTPIVPRIQAVRLATFSIVANAGTATSKAPHPKPIMQPSSMRSCIAGLLNVPVSVASFFSGFQFRETFVNPKEVPPMKIKTAQVMSAELG